MIRYSQYYSVNKIFDDLSTTNPAFRNFFLLIKVCVTAIFLRLGLRFIERQIRIERDGTQASYTRIQPLKKGGPRLSVLCEFAMNFSNMK